MWKCICGTVHRSIKRICDQCGRPYFEITKFTKQLDRLDLVLSLTNGTRAEIAEFEQTILACLGKNMSFNDIADYLAYSDASNARQLSWIIRNLNPNEAPSTLEKENDHHAYRLCIRRSNWP